MAMTNLTIQVGVQVLDATKGMDNDFYSFGARFSNCSKKQLTAIQKAANKHNESIHKGLQPFYAELEKLGVKPDTPKKTKVKNTLKKKRNNK